MTLLKRDGFSKMLVGQVDCEAGFEWSRGRNPSMKSCGVKLLLSDEGLYSE